MSDYLSESLAAYLAAYLGNTARRGSAWWYTRYHGGGIVSFAGACKAPEPHPFRYGSERDVQFMNGEIILRPAVVVGTDIYHGETMGGLLTNHHDIDDMLVNGEYVLGAPHA